MKRVIQTKNAGKPAGPYSQAIRSGNLLFISGTLPIDPSSGDIISGEIEEMTKRVMENIKALLSEEHLSMNHLVKVNIFLKDMSLFSRVNSVYKEYFDENPPARSAVGVSALPKNAEIEMEAIASYED
ncbi:MAG: RidA family protein [bacterium]